MSKKEYTTNYWPTPNFVMDRLIQYLTLEEFAVLMFIVRHTLGWQDKAETQSSHISLSSFKNGFTTRDGKHFGGCGVSKNKIIAALKALERFGVIRRSGRTQDGALITLVLNEDEIDWAGLQARAAARAARNRKRASNMATSRVETSVESAPKEPDTSVESAHTQTQYTSTTEHATPITAPDGAVPATQAPSTDYGTAMADGASSVPARQEHSSDADTGADTGLFEHIRDVLVERVWGGNRKMLDEASEMAKMLLGTCGRPPHSEHNLPRAVVRDEFDMWVRWWTAKRLHFPRDPGRLAKAWYDFRADINAQHELAELRAERRAKEQNYTAQLWADIFKASREFRKGETK